MATKTKRVVEEVWPSHRIEDIDDPEYDIPEKLKKQFKFPIGSVVQLKTNAVVTLTAYCLRVECSRTPPHYTYSEPRYFCRLEGSETKYTCKPSQIRELVG